MSVKTVTVDYSDLDRLLTLYMELSDYGEDDPELVERIHSVLEEAKKRSPDVWSDGEYRVEMSPDGARLLT